MPDSTGAYRRGASPLGGEWIAEYVERASDYWQRVGAAGAATAGRWGERSLENTEWTADTVTADIVESWESLTPLLGEGIELWLELLQRTMNGEKAGDGPTMENPDE